jgi:hypothetical protein
MDDEKEKAIGSTEPPRVHGLAPNSNIDLQNLPPDNEPQNPPLQSLPPHNINSQSSEHTIQNNTVQSSVAHSTTMERSSGKRALSPTEQPMQTSNVDPGINETSAAVKRMKLSHQSSAPHIPNCSICKIPHERGLSIQSMSASTNPEWAQIILNVLKPCDDAKTYKM